MTKPQEDPSSSATRKQESLDKKTVTWTISTYIAEGLPFMIVRFMSSVFFTDTGMREAYLGFLNFLGIPWNLKFLWAPVLDIVGTKRGWLLKIQFLIALFLFFVAFLSVWVVPGEGENNVISFTIALLFVVLGFLSATHDIAIDAYYLEALQSEEKQSLYSGLRVMAYRVAIIYTRSVLVIVAGVWGWFWGFGMGALSMLLLYLFHTVYLKPTVKQEFFLESEDKKEQLKKSLLCYLEAFLSYLRQEKALLVLLFIILYKLGDEILFSMNTPFLMRELGMTKAQLGVVAGIVGTGCAIVGSLLGGKWISLWGLKRAAFPLTLIMNITILAYGWLAYALPNPATTAGILIIAVVNGYEQFAAGLGTAVLIVFLMGKCQPEFKAAHYAIGSAIMSLGGTIMGGFGGVFVEHYGYLNLFLLGFVASVPSMLLLFIIPLERRTSS